MIPSLIFPISALFLAVFVNGAIIFDFFANGNTTLHEEGEFIENIAAFCFLCSAVLLLANSCFHTGLERFLKASIGAVNLMFFLREVDVANFNVPFPIREIASNNLKDGLFTLLFLILAIVALLKYRKQFGYIFKQFQNSIGTLYLGGGMLFLIASIFEQIDHHFIEELLESNSSFCFLCSSLLLANRTLLSLPPEKPQKMSA